MTRALITNDDGIDSPGLLHLARAAVAAGLEVVVAAPREDASGSSAALTAVQQEGRIIVEPRTLEGLDAPAYAVAGTPGFITLIAHRQAFGAAPDVVLSGINRGANTGNAILHSGTVGAALTGGTEGCRCLAVSLASGRPQHWETAALTAQRAVPLLLQLPAPVVLNLNVPDRPEDEVRGIRRAHLARFGAVQTSIAETGHGYVKLGVTERNAEQEAGSDMALLAAGYATITALNPICERTDLDVTAFEQMVLRSVVAPS